MNNRELNSPMNGIRAFFSQHNDDLDTSNFFSIPKPEYRYINEPISEDVNMNNRRIINCNEGVNENYMFTIKNLTVYYKKESTLNMVKLWLTKKIINVSDGTDLNDAVYFKQFTSLEDNVVSLDDKYIKREVNIISNVAIGYANMMAMPVLNVAPSADLTSAVNLS